MDTEDSNDCDNYESCLNANSTSDGTFSYTYTFAVDCKHLMACGKCELDGEECPVHKKKPKIKPHWVPRYYPYTPWWYYEPTYYVNTQWSGPPESNWHW